MLGKTHIAAGIASSLVLLQPSTLSGVLCSVAGGAAGGWLGAKASGTPKKELGTQRHCVRTAI